MNVLLARVLSLSEYGAIALGLSWLTIMAALACFGSETVTMRYVAQARAAGDKSTFAAVLIWGRRVAMSYGAIFSIISGCLVWIVLDYPKVLLIALTLIILTAPAFALMINRVAALKGAKRVVRAAAIENLFRPISILAFVGGAIWIGWRPDVIHVAALFVLVHFAMAIVAEFAIGSFAIKEQVPTPSQEREWLATAKPIALMNIAVVLIGNIDTVLVGFFVDPDAAGIYRASAQLANLVSFGLIASNGIVAPLIAELYGQNRHADLARLLRFSAALIAAVGIGGALTMGMLGHWALGLFGAAYVAGYGALLIMLVAQAVNAMCGPTAFMMTMTGHQSNAVKILSATAVVSIVLSAFLIPIFGVTGAAAAKLVSILIWNAALLIYIRRRLFLDPSIFGWFKGSRALA